MSILLIVLTIILTIGLITLWILWAAVIGAGFEPTSRRKVKKMLEMAEISSKDILYDLGSGDGRIVSEAAKNYNARAVGIEADPIRVLWSRLSLFFSGLSQAKIIWGNFFNENISEATIVTLFLGDKANQKLRSKLQEELKPGTPVVSYVWTFKGWVPVKIDHENRIYMYVIGKSDY